MEHHGSVICLVGAPSLVASTLTELFLGLPVNVSPAGPGVPTQSAAGDAGATNQDDTATVPAEEIGSHAHGLNVGVVDRATQTEGPVQPALEALDQPGLACTDAGKDADTGDAEDAPVGAFPRSSSDINRQTCLGNSTRCLANSYKESIDKAALGELGPACCLHAGQSSRGLGDFDFKDDVNRSTSEQKVRQSHNRIPGGPTLNVLAGGGNVCATDTEQSPPAEMMKYGPYVTGDAGREMGVHCARLDVSDSEPDSDHASQRDTVNIKMPPIPEFPIFAEYEALDREGSSWGTDSQRARNNRKGKGVTTKHEILNVRNNTGSEAVTAKQQQPRVAAPVAVIADPFGLNSFLAGPVSLGDEKHEALLFLRRKLLDYPKDDGKHCNVEHSIKRIDDKLAEARSN